MSDAEPRRRDGPTSRELEAVNQTAFLEYWWSRGHVDVLATVERVGTNGTHEALFGVRSNLINGLPPGSRGTERRSFNTPKGR